MNTHCTSEQGIATMVAAHLARAEEKATWLPERIRRAQAARAKLTDISDGGVQVVAVTEGPVEVLAQAVRRWRISRAPRSWAGAIARSRW